MGLLESSDMNVKHLAQSLVYINCSLTVNYQQYHYHVFTTKDGTKGQDTGDLFERCMEENENEKEDRKAGRMPWSRCLTMLAWA